MLGQLSGFSEISDILILWKDGLSARDQPVVSLAVPGLQRYTSCSTGGGTGHANDPM